MIVPRILDDIGCDRRISLEVEHNRRSFQELCARFNDHGTGYISHHDAHGCLAPVVAPHRRRTLERREALDDDEHDLLSGHRVPVTIGRLHHQIVPHDRADLGRLTVPFHVFEFACRTCRAEHGEEDRADLIPECLDKLKIPDGGVRPVKGLRQAVTVGFNRQAGNDAAVPLFHFKPDVHSEHGISVLIDDHRGQRIPKDLPGHPDLITAREGEHRRGLPHLPLRLENGVAGQCGRLRHYDIDTRKGIQPEIRPYVPAFIAPGLNPGLLLAVFDQPSTIAHD